MRMPPTRWLGYLVPLLALAALFAVRPRDAMRGPDWPGYSASLLYDEFDYSAMALRGLNAHRGRQAGGEPYIPGKWPTPEEFAARLAEDRPLAERYFLEYPHATLLLFRLGFALQPGTDSMPVAAAILDGDYHNLALHTTDNEEVARVLASCVRATDLYLVVMALATVALMAVLAWGYGGGLRAGPLLLLLPAALYFALNRFDVLPALLTALAFACLGRRWLAASAVVLGLAVVVKVYPLLLAPLVIRYLWDDRRVALRWAVVFGGTCALALTPLLFGTDWRAVWAPYHFQLTRAPEPGLTAYGFVLPKALGEGWLGSVFRFGCLGLLAAVLLRDRPADLAGVLRRSALLLLLFVSLAVFYSPQWIVWLVPLLAPLARTRPGVRRWAVALDVVTYLIFPFWFWTSGSVFSEFLSAAGADVANTAFGTLMHYGRFFITAALAWQLARDEWPAVVNWARIAGVVGPWAKAFTPSR